MQASLIENAIRNQSFVVFIFANAKNILETSCMVHDSGDFNITLFQIVGSLFTFAIMKLYIVCFVT